MIIELKTASGIVWIDNEGEDGTITICTRQAGENTIITLSIEQIAKLKEFIEFNIAQGYY